MAKLKAIRASNSSISSKSFTAVFVGATSGIGLGAIEALLKSTTSSKIFIVGRSKSTFAATLGILQGLSNSADIVFIEAQVSLLKEVDRVCAFIKAQESTIDLLWLSQGGMSLSGYELTSEGLNSRLAITYYSRTLFMHQLMPLVKRSSDPRIISVLATGHEGPIITTDIGLLDPNNDSFFPAMKQGVTMMSLGMRELSIENPKVSFIHTSPGMVSTDVHKKWAGTMTGYLVALRWLVLWVLVPLFILVGWTSEEAGEIGLYEMTNEKFSANSGKNFIRLGGNGSGEEEGPQPDLSKYMEDGTQKKVWEHTLGVFDKILAQKSKVEY
ncbi:Oxidoreductase lepF [Hyphodiscus hymeniophilus]|uniref:Oxidoreductase lepF n=1 Tax=Hyphodiscus hymeniophilus TaxID=353542 RepID=A0A9P6VI86_9HELO|nr:Oxidoreductase lepF [Hyphodiscus hymeniophilus]